MVDAFVRGARFVQENPDETAAIAADYIGIGPDIVREALRNNQPNLDAIRNQAAMDQVLSLMSDLDYIGRPPENYLDLSFLDTAQAAAVS